MSNEVAVRQNTAVAVYDDDPFAEFAQEAGNRNIVGSLLKFSKGDWTAGQDNDDVPEGTTFVANMFEMMRGWVRWEDNKPTDQVMGKVFMRYKPSPRRELGDNDKSQWEVDENGKERDPWQETYYLLLKGAGDAAPNGAPADELFTFPTSSKGGKDGIAKLSEAYSKGKRKQKDDTMLPIVAIGHDFYMHKKFGKIKTPAFKIVGWAPKSVFDDLDGGAGDDGEGGGGFGREGEEVIDKETGEVTTAPKTKSPTTATGKTKPKF